MHMDTDHTKDVKSAYDDRLDDLFEALNMLYIRNNISGRNRFREKWEQPARHIFGEELIAYDNDGTDDKIYRCILEEQAEERCAELKYSIKELKQKSVKSGSLQFEYVGEVIDRYGPDLSPFLYTKTIIERVRPGLLPRPQQENAPATQAAMAEPDDIPQTAPSDLHETVRPIETPLPQTGQEQEKHYVKIPEPHEVQIPPVVAHARTMHDPQPELPLHSAHTEAPPQSRDAPPNPFADTVQNRPESTPQSVIPSDPPPQAPPPQTVSQPAQTWNIPPHPFAHTVQNRPESTPEAAPEQYAAQPATPSIFVQSKPASTPPAPASQDAAAPGFFDPEEKSGQDSR